MNTASNNESPAIVTRRLTKYYGGRRVVDSLDLTVPRGCVYGFLGRNGAGKSTTIRMLLGLVEPDSGRAQLLGEDSDSLRPQTRQRIAYLAENHPLYRWMSIGDAVRFFRSFYPTWNQPEVDQILDHFELPRKKKIRHLSNGQRAQVALALAVAPDPEIFILDDPTLGLDTVVRRDFLESLIQIIHRKGRTILFSSHILNDVERVADRIGILVGGVLRADCPLDTFKETVKKIVVEFGRQPPAFPSLPHIVGSRQMGSRLEIVAAPFTAEHQRHIESLDPKRWEVVDLNLEDAFIEYTRGVWNPLPIFAGQRELVEA